MNDGNRDLSEDTPADSNAAGGKAPPPSGAPVVMPTHSTTSSALPDWAPWAVLAGLVGLGLLGGTGLVPLTIPGLGESKAAAATPTVAVAAPQTPKPVLSARADGDAEERASVLQLVVTYEGTMLAKSRNIQRSAAEAKTRALEALTRARKGEDFQKLVDEYTDQPPMAGQKGAILGFKRSQALPEFSNAAFALEPGQISDIVQTQFGYHVILRTK